MQKRYSMWFPTEVTFFSIIYYIFLFYLCAYIVFHIYIYLYELEYEINCKNNGKCIQIRPKSTLSESSSQH